MLNLIKIQGKYKCKYKLLRYHQDGYKQKVWEYQSVVKKVEHLELLHLLVGMETVSIILEITGSTYEHRSHI